MLKKIGLPAILIIVCLGMGLLIGVNIHKPDNTQYFQKPGFKTDTITKPIYKEDTGGKNAATIPPKIVYRYTEVPVPVIKYVPTIIHDTIQLVDTATGKKINIYPCWYNSYIGIPKLIAARFTKNGISLDLYDTGCKLYTKVYQTDYESYDYFWNGNDIKIKKAQMNTIPKVGAFWKQFSTSCNVYVTEELVNMRPYLSADYSLNFRSIGLYTMGSVGYKNDFDARVNVGIKIKLR